MISTDEIRQALAIYGGRQIALAAATGVSQSTVSRWLKGATPDPEQEDRLRAIIGVPNSAPSSLAAPQQSNLFGDRDLPVYAAVEGGPGELVISKDAIDYVPRPWYLGNVRDGYGVIVVGESMSPAYNPGDMAIIHPRVPVIVNKTYIFTSDDGDGTFRGTIKRLVGQSTDEWKVEQHNPHRVFSLSKAEWPKALRVVGKYEN